MVLDKAAGKNTPGYDQRRSADSRWAREVLGGEHPVCLDGIVVREPRPDWIKLDVPLPKRDGFDEAPAAWIERDGKMQQLFAEKGGQQVCLTISPGGGYPPALRKVTWLETHQWRNRLRAAITQERGY